MPKGKQYSKRGDITAVEFHGQLPLLQHDSLGWFLWIEYNEDRTIGTYLRLQPYGQIVKYTVRNGDIESIQKVKPIEI